MTITIDNGCGSCVLGSGRELYKEVRQLHRLHTVYKTFLSEKIFSEIACIRRTKNAWQQTLQEIRTRPCDEILAEIEPKIMRCCGAEKYSLYRPKIQKIKSAEDMKKYVCRFIDELNGIWIPPLQKSRKGIRGPTFLVSYAKQARTRAYVVKWTDLHELFCSHVYKEFSFCRERTASSVAGIASFSFHGHGFDVPQAVLIDLSEKYHRDPNFNLIGPDRLGLSEQQFEKLASSLRQITCDLASENAVKDAGNTVMFSESINGANLFDFARGHYSQLDKAGRRKLFNRLGRLALLDLILGNLDRLMGIVFVEKEEKYDLGGIVFVKKEEKYDLGDLEANLGNVMVTMQPISSEDEETLQPFLFAIDNGIEEKLINDKQHKAKYLEFLETIAAADDFGEMLTANILISVANAVKLNVDDCGHENVQVLREKLNPFLKDLQYLAYEEVLNGIWLMYCHLFEERFAPENMFLNLEGKNPAVISAVRQRLEFFRNLEIRRKKV